MVCCVIHNRWEVPSVARIDAAYAQELSRLADQTLAQAREVVGDSAEFVTRTGRSVARVLLAEAAAQSARVLVCGSSGAGSWGHIALGSVSDRLLHSADVAIGLAPRGYRICPSTTIPRVTVAMDASANAAGVLAAAARVIAALGAELRVVTFAVRGRSMYPPRAGFDVEDKIIASWKEQARQRQDHAVRELARLENVSTPSEVLLADGRDWLEALDGIDWRDGEVLAVGSSPLSPLARVFVGSTAARIIRYAPVPVVVVPTASLSSAEAS